jgi:hypothetical protein
MGPASDIGSSVNLGAQGGLPPPRLFLHQLGDDGHEPIPDGAGTAVPLGPLSLLLPQAVGTRSRRSAPLEARYFFGSGRYLSTVIPEQANRLLRRAAFGLLDKA